MITFLQGDILRSGAEAVVNTVNCVGVMGRGIALQFKNAYPANFKAYAAACKRGEVQPGRMFVFDVGPIARPRYIVNFPTKRHWRGKSRLEDIAAGLEALVAEVAKRGIRSVAIPPLGAGLGGLDWGVVRPLVEQAAAAMPEIEVEVYEPGLAASDRSASRCSEVPEMTVGRAALVSLVRRYLGALMDPSITLLEIHKLMYFLQVAGQPLQLSFVKGHYGPYAENLRHVLRHVEGHLLTGYADGGDEPEKELALVPGAVRDADARLASEERTRQRLERVAQLVEGFETPFGLELLATVHWVMTHEPASSLDEIVRATHAWGARKEQFRSTQIATALERIRSQRWVEA